MSAAVAARLYADVVAPLVLGGSLRPGRIIGGALALELATFAGAVDSDQRSRTDLGRIHAARGLLAIDLLPEANSTDWALFACVHDWLAAASPELASVLSPRAPERTLDLVTSALAHMKPPRDAYEALSRHTFFSRLLEIRRSDIQISFWAGSRTFLGTSPPERLLAWPEFRRVKKTTTARPLVTLPEHGAKVDKERWLSVLERLLRLTPLTDLATLTRESPTFTWSRETLALAATHAGRTLAVRAMARHPAEEVLTATGRATKLLSLSEAWTAVGVAADLLAEIVLRLALEVASGEWSRLVAAAEHSKDLAHALTIGSLTGVTLAERTLTPDDASAATRRLLPLTRATETLAGFLIAASPR